MYSGTTGYNLESWVPIARRCTGFEDMNRSWRNGTIQAIKDQVSCDLEGESVILSLSSGTYFGLNEVGARIWDILQKPCTYEEIVAFIGEQYAVDQVQLESDLDRLLEDMLRAKLIEVSDANNKEPRSSQMV